MVLTLKDSNNTITTYLTDLDNKQAQDHKNNAS